MEGGLGSETPLARRYALQDSEEWQVLLRHFELSESFAFIVVLAPDGAGIRVCRTALQQFLESRGLSLLTKAFATPEELATLPEYLVLDLSVPEGTGAIWIESATDEGPDDTAFQTAWRRATALLNQHRNPLRRRFHTSLIFAGPPWLQAVLRGMAPDLWSVVSLVVRVEPLLSEPPDPPTPAYGMVQRPGPGTYPDPDYAMERAARLRGKPEHEGVLAALLQRAGTGYFARYHDDLASQVLQESLLFYRQSGDVRGAADSLKILGDIALRRHAHIEARTMFEEALALYGKTESLPGQADCIKRLGDTALECSDYAEARRMFEEALTLYRRIENIPGQADCTKRLGDAALECSNQAEARTRFEEALALYQQAGDLPGEADCIKRLGDTALSLSDHAGARRRFEEALTLYQKAANLPGEADCIKRLGDTALSRSDYAEARRRFEEAIAMYERMHEPYWIGQVHRRLALLSANVNERQTHVQSAREAWLSIHRHDLIEELDQQFPDLAQPSS